MQDTRSINETDTVRPATLTFEQIAERVAAHYQQPAPIDGPTAGLTQKGHAAVAGYRFVKALRELAPEDRAATLSLFAGELRDVIADLAAPATA
jgi:hypothetical protein